MSPTADAQLNVLFLCTGNSARSILAEAMTNHAPISGGKFRAYSAGSDPKGEVDTLAVEILRQSRIPTDGLRSKSWEEFAAAGAPKMDFVFTVCDQAAMEPCPIWPGQPMTAHWGVPDPAGGGHVGAGPAPRLSGRRAGAQAPDRASCQSAAR
jgi:arsenate reductase